MTLMRDMEIMLRYGHAKSASNAVHAAGWAVQVRSGVGACALVQVTGYALAKAFGEGQPSVKAGLKPTGASTGHTFMG